MLSFGIRTFVTCGKASGENMGIYTPFFMCLAQPCEGQKVSSTLCWKKMTLRFIFFVQVSLSHSRRSPVLVFVLASGAHNVRRALPVGSQECCSTEQLYFSEISKPEACRFCAAAICGSYCYRDLNKKTEDAKCFVSRIQAGFIQHMVSCFYL